MNNQGLTVLEKSFKNEVEKNPGLSSFFCWGRVVRGKKLSESVVGRGFRKFVDKNDYAHENIDKLILHFMTLTNEENSSKSTA